MQSDEDDDSISESDVLNLESLMGGLNDSLAGGSWTDGLAVNSERMNEVLGDSSPTFQSIKACGELLRKARICLFDLQPEAAPLLELEGRDREQITVDLLEALSCFVRTPASRFYESFIFVDKIVIALLTEFSPSSEWTDVEFHTAVVASYSCQVMSVMSSQRGDSAATESFVTEAMRMSQRCVVARPKDASMYVVAGNFLMVQGRLLDAIELLEEAVKLDEHDNFGARFTLANICVNRLPEDLSSVKTALERLKMHAIMKQLTHNLRRYLALAPDCHWHVHRACMVLGTYCGAEIANGSEALDAIEARHPGYAAEVLTCFKRGVKATEQCENWIGREESDFKYQAKQTSSLVARLYKLGLIDEEPPANEYLCANRGCVTDHFSQSLSWCSRCHCVSYCSRPCQVSHWKEGGHKQACKTLKAEREARRKANPHRLKRPDVTPQQE